jgi:hypothetical protein
VACCAVQEASVAKAVEDAGELPEEATAALVITGLKRPFTSAALTQVLAESGIVKGEGRHSTHNCAGGGGMVWSSI